MRRIREAQPGVAEERDAEFPDMLLQPVEILHAQEGEAVVPRIRSRIGCERARLLQMAYQLEDAAEAESDAVVEDSHRLCAEDFRVPVGGLRQIAAGHGYVGDVAAAGDRRVVQQTFGRPDLRCFHDAALKPSRSAASAA